MSENLLTELKDIVIQREGIIEDIFYELIEKSKVLDIDKPMELEGFFKEVSK